MSRDSIHPGIPRRFTEALDNFGAAFRPRNDGPQVKAVDVQRVRDEFLVRYISGDPDKARQSASRTYLRAVEKLPPDFSTESRDGVKWIWRTK